MVIGFKFYKELFFCFPSEADLALILLKANCHHISDVGGIAPAEHFRPIRDIHKV